MSLPCAHDIEELKNEMLYRNNLKEAADSIGLPTFVVADAGRTQVFS